MEKGETRQAQFADGLWSLLDVADDESALLQSAVERLAVELRARTVALVVNDHGSWQAVALAGSAETLPYPLLERAAESEQDERDGPWWVCPLGRSSLLLALSCADSTPAMGALGREIADTLYRVWRHCKEDAETRRRIARMQGILDLAAHWQSTLDMDELLERMAVTSTKLVGAERASIFLWDRANRELVAHPALGVPGGELRIPEDTGVVGRVIRTGQVLRVDPSESEQVDRRVDVKLRFHTRSLLCAPLHDARGRIIGAFEVINKEGANGRFSVEDEETLVELARHASLALVTTQAYQRIVQSRNRLVDELADSVRLIGNCPAICALRETLQRIAQVDLTVLIQGESGTGKEVVARILHFSGSRRDGPFIAVNSGALAENLMESELFGHEKGSFTGADEAKAGKFEQASGGTLFLDEIGELSEAGQVKLLRVLEQRVVTRVGGKEEIPVDVRVVAATNRDLAERVREGEFREDLFYRLSGIPLTLPPLRERGDDVIELARFFLQRFARECGRAAQELSADAMDALRSHRWPGNIRELRNMMERVALLVPEPIVKASDLVWQQPVREPTADDPIEWDLPFADATREFQIAYIRRHLERAGGSVTEAARKLGLHRSNLYRKMKQLGMEP